MNQRTIVEGVLQQALDYRGKWQDQPEAYWLMRLVEEVGELGAALAGDHEDSPDHELWQIASICVNWLTKRAESAPPH